MVSPPNTRSLQLSISLLHPSSLMSVYVCMSAYEGVHVQRPEDTLGIAISLL